MKSRQKQRAKRAIAGQKKAQAEQSGRSGPTLVHIIDGLIGIVVGLALLYWVYTGMWASCMSWLP